MIAYHGVDWDVYEACCKRLENFAHNVGNEKDMAGVFEALCACEQTISDALTLVPGLQSTLMKIVNQLRAAQLQAANDLFPECLTAKEQKIELVEAVSAMLPDLISFQGSVVSDLEDGEWIAPDCPNWDYVGPRHAEALSTAAIDLRRYSERIEEDSSSIREQRICVVGIRTGGSYLGPLWASALQRHGIDAEFVTVRPMRWLMGVDSARDRGVKWLKADIAVISGHSSFIVVDDSLYTGDSFVAVAKAICDTSHAVDRIVCHAGWSYYGIESYGTSELDDVRARSVTFARATDVEPRVPFFRPEISPKEYFADLLAGYSLRVISVASAGPSYWAGYADWSNARAAQEIEPRVTGDTVREQQYVIECSTPTRPRRSMHVLATYVGFGVFANAELSRLELLAPENQPLFVSGGYLFSRAVDGTTMGFGERQSVCEADLRYLAELESRLYRFALREWVDYRNIQRAVQEECELIAPYVDERPSRLAVVMQENAPVGIPIVRLPSNQGHWHYVRRKTEGLLRLRPEAGAWSRFRDTAWDLASMILELGLGQVQSSALLSFYRRSTGDDSVEGRLWFHILGYAAQVLRGYEERESALAWVGDKRVDATRKYHDVRRSTFVDVTELATAVLEGDAMVRFWQLQEERKPVGFESRFANDRDQA